MLYALATLWAGIANADEPLSQRGAWEGRVDYFMTGAALAENTNPPPGGNTDYDVDRIVDGVFEVRAADVQAGATLLAAKLFWAGSQTQPGAGCSSSPDTQVTLATPSTAATVVTAETCYCSDGGSGSYDVQACSADVSGLIGNDLVGSYTVSDYQGRVNNNGTDSAGTALLLVYEEPSLPERRVVLYDGNYVLDSRSNQTEITFNLGGFTVDSGAQADLTAFVMEGEVSTAGDRITVNGLPGGSPPYEVFDAVNPVDDIFNRTINTQGLTDVAGVDIDQFDISQGVDFLDTSIDVSYTISADKVWVVANVVGVDQFFSQLSDLSRKTWTLTDDTNNDGIPNAGDTVTYQLHLENSGNETATVDVTDTFSGAFSSWTPQLPFASGTDASSAVQLRVAGVQVPAGGSVDLFVDAVIGPQACSTSVPNTFTWSAPLEGGVGGSKDAPSLNVVVDRDGDTVGDCLDNCPDDPNTDQADADNDGTGDVCDTPPEVCDGEDNDLDGTTDEGWDADGDELGDCLDECPNDPGKTVPGVCGCGVADEDTDEDGTENCNDECPNDPDKVEEGFCGCGVADTDTDGDGTPDCGDREVCDGLDNDGDGLVDDEDPSLDPAGQTQAYADEDGDQRGDPDNGGLFCTPPAGWVADNTDCDDANALRYPDLADTCDGIDNDCDLLVDENTECTDDDGDGFTELGGDCDDTNEDISPTRREGCNGVDDDCDLAVDEQTDCVDDDGDGYCEGVDIDSDGTLDCREDALPGDCNDADPNASPNNFEVGFNGVDDDCDGQVDAEITDSDGDGYTEDGGDCDLSDPSSYPGGEEVADQADNDCDGRVDEGTAVDDVDGDGYCVGEDVDGDKVLDCAGDAQPGDCWEGESCASPAALEQLNNGVDDDCDGAVDEGTDNTDDDGDGLSENAGDCDDSDPDVYPGADEVLNGVDDNCNDQIDEGLSDFDGDGWSEADGDCDDSDGWVNPGLLEICDDLDNDCDQLVDEDSCDGGGVVVPPAEGCSCANSRGGSPLLALVALLVVRGRRRPTRRL